MADPLKQIFDSQQVLNGLFGATGAAFGSMGKEFGETGGKFGIEGADNIPKFDVKDYFSVESTFKLEDHYDPKRLFDGEKMANDFMSAAIGSLT